LEALTTSQDDFGGCSFRLKKNETSTPRAKPMSVVPISSMARGMVMLRKRSFVSTGSVFCRMIMTPSRANMAVAMSLKRSMAGLFNFFIH